jgi:hypothetical protein
MATIKAQLRDQPESNFDRAFAESEAPMIESFAADDLEEGVARYRERRPPQLRLRPARARRVDRARLRRDQPRLRRPRLSSRSTRSGG